jgi:hypothetical protein
VGRWAEGSGQQRLSDAGEAGECCGEVIGPGPAGGDLDEAASAAADDPDGGVQQPVAEQFRFGLGQLAGEQDRLVQAIRSAAVNASCSQTECASPR